MKEIPEDAREQHDGLRERMSPPPVGMPPTARRIAINAQAPQMKNRNENNRN